MCTGGRLLADFVAGGRDRAEVPDWLVESMTTTTDGAWVVWAYKLARVNGDRFVPLRGRGSYPADATAECLVEYPSGKHKAPEPSCTCGFHALSSRGLLELPVRRSDMVYLQVVLSGRVLAFEWEPGGVLLRAERQTVVRSGGRGDDLDPIFAELGDRFFRGPDDPDGRVVRRPTATPHGSGPVRMSLPSQCPSVGVADDAGWCQLGAGEDRVPLAAIRAV